MGAMAESFVAYAQPLLDQTDGSEEQLNKAFAITQLCFNLALLPDDQRDTVLGGQPHDLNDLLGRGRRQHCRSGAMNPPAPIGDPRLDLFRIGDDAAVFRILVGIKEIGDPVVKRQLQALRIDHEDFDFLRRGAAH